MLYEPLPSPDSEASPPVALLKTIPIETPAIKPITTGNGYEVALAPAVVTPAPATKTTASTPSLKVVTAGKRNIAYFLPK
ncbi:hypothetical protein WICMUC_000356 [Wickerhamomyces mucosus]|uniref:Uncharacterized protein n=1 Tax=Wickerhamomyces mucosus TaxID=1378264 RepID=A0A9P8PZI4_9ASCO|nr:hypothetical protein WICMUC_000356 [Wickerhamomyces mucosus]